MNGHSRVNRQFGVSAQAGDAQPVSGERYRNPNVPEQEPCSFKPN
jgi:hypothetical protein